MTDDYLGITEVARLLGWKVGTIRNYMSRGTFPKPDRRSGDEWKRETIERWQEVTHGRRGLGSADRPD